MSYGIGQPTVELTTSLGDAIRVATAYDGATGGAKIQAAIDDLPDQGGTVFIPAEGPDDGVTNANGSTENGVWAVGTKISTNGKNAVKIVGASPGWVNNSSGTRLIATAAVDAVLEMTGGFLDSVNDLRIDGANTAVRGLRLGAGGVGGNNDFQALRVMVHSCGTGIQAYARRNIWLDNCWVELCSGAGVSVEMNAGAFWATNHLSYANETAFTINEPITRLWIHQLRSGQETQDGIRILSAITDGWITDSHFWQPGQNTAATYDGISIQANLARVQIKGNIIDGEASQTRHGINRVSGTLTDCEFSGNRAYDISGNELNGITGSGNGVRTLVNGLGYNAGNPAAAGDWNTQPREGATVHDDVNSLTYLYANGAWRQVQ